jgi:hypothetical protein
MGPAEFGVRSTTKNRAGEKSVGITVGTVEMLKSRYHRHRF